MSKSFIVDHVVLEIISDLRTGKRKNIDVTLIDENVQAEKMAREANAKKVTNQN